MVEATREAVRLTQVLVGTLDEVAPSLPDRYFDLVVCNDVIEHIVDTRQTMATIRAKMTDGGFALRPGAAPPFRIPFRRLLSAAPVRGETSA